MTHRALSLPAGTVIDRYQVHQLLGQGGFAAVYFAEHVHLGHPVALKVLHPELAQIPEMLERFFREARAAAAIGSPHIVEVVDSGQAPDGTPFLAMELLDGVSLEDALDRRELPFEPDVALSILLQVLDGLAAAHSAGIIHRDLKPANIFIEKSEEGGLLKLLDFGVSKVKTGRGLEVLTRSGAWLGTPLYMAPEQFRGARDVDERADLYSLAAIGYELLAGDPPFLANTTTDLIRLVATTPHTPLGQRRPGIPPGLAAVLERGLAKDPDGRWPDVLAMSAALRGSLEPASDEELLHQTVGVTSATVFAGSTDAREQRGRLDWPSPNPVTERETYPDSAAAANLETQPAAGHPNAPLRPPQRPTPEKNDSPAPSDLGHRQREDPTRKLQLKLILGLIIIAGVLLGGITAAAIIALAPHDEAERSSSQQPRLAIPTMPPPPETPVATQNPPSPAPAAAQPAPTTPQPAPLPAPTAAPTPTPTPTPPRPESVSLRVTNIIGSLDAGAVQRLMDDAQDDMERCRPSSQATTAHCQLMVNPDGVPGGRIAIAGPRLDVVTDRSAAQCVSNVVRRAAGSSWSPTGSGIAQYEVTLQPR